MSFTKFKGALAMHGSILYSFHRKGKIAVARAPVQEDKLHEFVLGVGVGKLTTAGDHYLITTAHDSHYPMSEASNKAGAATEVQKDTYVPKTTAPVAVESAAAQVPRLCEALKANDDLQKVYSNFDVPKETLPALNV